MEQESSLTALVTGFSNEILKHFKTSLNNVIFDFDNCLNIVNFYAKNTHQCIWNTKNVGVFDNLMQH